MIFKSTEEGLRSFIIFIFFAFFSLLSIQAKEITVSFKNNKKNYSIKSIIHKDQTFASLNDLSSLLSLKSNFTNKNLFEITFSKKSLKILEGSPFYIIKKNSDFKASTKQLSTEFISDEEEIFFPVKLFLPVLSDCSGISFDFDEKNNHLTINSNSNNTTNSRLTDVSTYTIWKKANGYIIKIPSKSRKKVTHSYDQTNKIVRVKIGEAKADITGIESKKPLAILEKVKVTQYPSSAEIQFHLKQDIESQDIFYSSKTSEIYILLFQRTNLDSIFKSERRKKKIEDLSDIDKKIRKWNLEAVVIDAGHGGKDPGCISTGSKYEKNITLNIASKLGKLLEKKLKLKVFYTRKTDIFVPLYRRGQFANEKRGNLFISIHCNSMPKGHSNINGFETYILRPGKTAEAIAVAENENAVIKLEDDYEKRYKSLTDENFILTAIAQNAFVKFSELFAEVITDYASKNITLKNNGVNQAGFFVLVGASMPSILVESGYLSNKKDEKYLLSNSGQQQVAECLFNAIKEFKSTYEKTLEEGK